MGREYEVVKPNDPRHSAAKIYKLTAIWFVYSLIVAALVCFALWTGDWKWNAEVMMFSWPLLVIAPSLAILRLFVQIHGAAMAGVERWSDVFMYGAPITPVRRFKTTTTSQKEDFRAFNPYDMSRPEYWSVPHEND